MIIDENLLTKKEYEKVYNDYVKNNNFIRFYNHGFYSKKKLLNYSNFYNKFECEANLYAHLICDYNIDAKNKSLLDIGCGLGLGTNLLKTHFEFKDVSGLDFVTNHISFAKKNFKEINFFEYDCNNLINLNLKYDCIVSVESIMYYIRNDTFLEGLRNCLNDGGKILIATMTTGENIKFNDVKKLDLIYYLKRFKSFGFNTIKYNKITKNVIESLEHNLLNIDKLNHDKFKDINIIRDYGNLMLNNLINYKLNLVDYYSFCVEKDV